MTDLSIHEKWLVGLFQTEWKSGSKSLLAGQINTLWFKQCASFEIEDLQSAITSLSDRGWVEAPSRERLQLTDLGMQKVLGVAPELLKDKQESQTSQ